LVNCHVSTIEWPLTIGGAIQHLELIQCTVTYIDFLRLVDVTLPKSIRLYGQHFGDSLHHAMAGLPHHDPRLECLSMFDVVDEDSYEGTAETIIHSLVRTLIDRNLPCTVVFDSSDFSDGDVLIQSSRVNFYRQRLAHWGNRKWEKINYHTNNVVNFRDTRGHYLFADDNIFN
jgi:hypothetical protein